MIGTDMYACLWECKDFADGWIRFSTEEEAAEYQRETGCLVRVYYRPNRQSTRERANG